MKRSIAILPSDTAVSLAAMISRCPFIASSVCGLRSWKQRTAKVLKSCRSRVSYSARVDRWAARPRVDRVTHLQLRPHLGRPADERRRLLSAGPPRSSCHHLRDERRKLPPPCRARTKARPRPPARPRDNHGQRLIAAPRQYNPQSPLRDSHATAIMPMPRRRISHPDCRCFSIQIAALHSA
jgi:hypothetical protein